MSRDESFGAEAINEFVYLEKGKEWLLYVIHLRVHLLFIADSSVRFADE